MKNNTSIEKNISTEIISKCRICGSELASNIIKCSSCDTPSHSECRNWAQGCPVYGCKEMSHALHEELSGVAPQEQHEAYHSLVGRMWKTLNTPIGNLFQHKPQKVEYLSFPVPIDGQQLAVTKQYLDNSASRTQQEWWKRDGPETLLNVRQQYAMLRWLYHNPKDKAGMEFLRLFRKDFSSWWKWYHTGTRIQYGNSLEAVIDELQPDKSIASTSVQVPEFTKYSECWSYLVLAKEQPASQLGCVEHIPENVQPFLNALLGKGYEEAGAVFQYCSSQRNGNLLEVQLWTPTAIYRNVQRAVVLGTAAIGSSWVLMAT